jgi:ferrous iron transport protein A
MENVMLRKNGKKNGCCFADRVKNCFGRKPCKDLIGPLSKRARTGRIKVWKVVGDRKICARMASMGLYPGVEADVICSENGSQCVLKVNGGTISLDSDISENIFVSSL